MSSGSVVCSLLFAVLACCLGGVTEALNAQCLACSYTIAGDGSTDRECVTNATHFDKTTKIACNFDTHSCVIIAVYESGYTRLNSLSRNCEATPNGPPADGCDGGVSPRCRTYCQSDLCNDGHGDLYSTRPSDGVAPLGLKMALLLLCGGLSFLLMRV